MSFLVAPVVNFVKDWFAHHPKDKVIELDGIQLIIRQESLNWTGHEIRCTVLFSPENKMDNYHVTAHTCHASSAKTACLHQLLNEVRNVYHTQQ